MFGTNDVKYHLFTLMVFDFHRIRVLVAWVITNQKPCEDMVEWLNVLQTKLFSHMPDWKPSCFIMDDVL